MSPGQLADSLSEGQAVNPPKPTVGDDAEKRADAVIVSWIGNRVSMRLQRDAIAEAIRDAVTDALCEPEKSCADQSGETGRGLGAYGDYRDGD